MTHADIIFPRRIGPLTYTVPPSLVPIIAPGVIVEAELGKSLARGVVLGPSEHLPSGRLKPISAICAELQPLPLPLLSLARWMAEHYFSTEGVALKSMLPDEYFHPVTARPRLKNPKPARPKARLPEVQVDEGLLGMLSSAMNAGAYKAMLLHAPSTRYEAWFAIRAAEAAKEKRGIIIAAPEMDTMAMMEGPLREVFGSRLVLYHARLSRGGRSEALAGMRSGESDVVLGSLSAIYAPIERASLICVLREESPLYKAESGSRASGRDAAVMRAWLEGACVLLSSICPSVESWHNSQTGKYTLLDASKAGQRPKVRVLGIKDDPVSATLMSAITRAASKSEGALLYINRKGHSTLRCSECGYLSTCRRCKVPLVWLKSAGMERCVLCGTTSRPSQTCPKCGSPALGPSGAGIDRIAERVRAELKGIAQLSAIEPLKVDAKARDRVNLLLSGAGPGIAVGTRTLTRAGALSEGFGVVAVMNADSYLYAPDFRAGERAFQDFLYASDKASHGGTLFVQSRRPRQALLGYLRNFSFRRFYESMLHERSEAGYPPFMRLAVFAARISRKEPLPSVFDLPNSAMALGPVPLQAKENMGRYLVKAATRQALLRALRVMKAALKDRETEVVVDPLEF